VAAARRRGARVVGLGGAGGGGWITEGGVGLGSCVVRGGWGCLLALCLRGAAGDRSVGGVFGAKACGAEG